MRDLNPQLKPAHGRRELGLAVGVPLRSRVYREGVHAMTSLGHERPHH